MYVSNAEFLKVISENAVFIDKTDVWRFILFRSPLKITIDGVAEMCKIGQYCLCSPGHSVLPEPVRGYGVADYVEFSPSESETVRLRSLPISFDSIVSPPNWPDLSILVQMISGTFNSSDTYRQEKIGGLLTVLFYGIAAGDDTELSTPSAGRVDDRLLRLRRKLSDNLSVRPTVEEAAARVGLSVSRFEYLYKQNFGISFVNDLIRLRIRRSCILLSTTDWTVCRIAEALGYENESNYYRQFRQQVGISPKEYRKMLKNEAGTFPVLR